MTPSRRLVRRVRWPVLAATVMAAAAMACGGGSPDAGREGAPAAGPRPSILLVTLDTTRADAIGPGAKGGRTPAFDAVAGRGRYFRQAYATAPETLPSHSSMLTGLYPAGHGVRENGRRLADAHDVAADRLQQAGYRTAAFVSSFVLDRRFGLGRGFDVYDDEMPDGRVERSARETTDRVMAHLGRMPAGSAPSFIWVHYFDPHAPYAPPEPFLAEHASSPYHGEIAAMDAELGRLVEAFERAAAGGPVAIIVAADHGEGLGDHGEALHGNLVYQSTMHVPLVVVGPGLAPGAIEAPVSTRRIFHTLMDLAGLGAEQSLAAAAPGAAEPVVLGEAMRPFLSYGWQPQVMGVAGRQKAIVTGRTEIYDLAADPGETRDLSRDQALPEPVRQVIEGYPIPSPGETARPDATSAEDRQKLASLGYVSARSSPAVRRDAPRPVDMVGLFGVIDRASGLFVAERYAEVIPLLEQILQTDPNNLDATLRLATALSATGRRDRAVAAFRRAASIAPQSPDVPLYLALHYARGPEWAEAAPMLERVLAATPDRLPALEALAAIRERQERGADALALRQRLYALRAPSPDESVRLGRLAMDLGQTPVALEAFERARAAQGPAFAHHLELGVLYVAARRYSDARDALDRVPASHPGYPMALFKRAQVSVLLNEPDQAARIQRARDRADATTRPLIESERLFGGGRGSFPQI